MGCLVPVVPPRLYVNDYGKIRAAQIGFRHLYVSLLALFSPPPNMKTGKPASSKTFTPFLGSRMRRSPSFSE